MFEYLVFGGLAVLVIFAFLIYQKIGSKNNENSENEKIEEFSDGGNKLSDEIEKLNQLLNDGVLTKEEFEKAKKKLLDN